MREDIVTSLDIVTRNVKYYITSENNTGGILEDVNTIIRSSNTDVTIDEPAVWIIQHPTIMKDENAINLNGVQQLETTFEFVCVEYDDDLEASEIKGINLASRVAKCILKNFNKIKDNENDPVHIFDNVNMEALYPVGEVNVEGKAKRIPATSVVMKFTYTVNWKKCRIPQIMED